MMTNASVLPPTLQEPTDVIQTPLYNTTTEDDGVAMATNADNLAMTRFIVQRVLVPVVTSVGVFGNVISISVLAQRCMVSSTNWYLRTLAIFDLLYLIFSFTLSLNHYRSVRGEVPYIYWFHYGRVLTDICSNVSVCLTVTFSLERLVAVCYPMKGRIICTAERARLITIIVSLAAICCTAPEFFEWKTVEKVENNVTTVENEDSDMVKSTSYSGYQYFIVVVFTILPLILLCVFNGLLIKAVMTATRIRKQMVYTSVQTTKDTRRRQSEEQRITLMLIVVVIVFLLCQFPNAALILYRAYLNREEIELSAEDTNYVIIAGNVVNLLVLINASVNFILYSAMSTKFRRVAVRMLCRFSQRRRYKPQFTRTEMSYYNSAASVKLHGAPLRFRSMRVENHGVNTSVNGYCATEMEQNLGTSASRESSRSYDSSNKSMKTALTKSSSNSDTHSRISPADNSPVHNAPVHVINGAGCMQETKLIKNALIIWKGSIPLGDIPPGSFEGAKNVKGDMDQSLGFKISTTHVLAKRMRGRSKNTSLFDDTSL